MPLEQTHAAFATTRWTLMDRLHSGDAGAREAALAAVVRAYWPPVYATLRRSGHGREGAAEITQAFFAEVVLTRDLLAQADPQRGRLRTFIQAALKNFLVDRHRRRESRGGGRAILLGDLEREEQFLTASPGTDAATLFDRRWVLAVVEEALRRCEQHYRETGKPRNWEAFAGRIVRPAIGHAPPMPLPELVAQWGFGSPADVAAAVQTVKKRLRALLREVIAEVSDEASEEDEFRRIAGVLGP